MFVSRSYNRYNQSDVSKINYWYDTRVMVWVTSSICNSVVASSSNVGLCTCLFCRLSSSFIFCEISVQLYLISSKSSIHGGGAVLTPSPRPPNSISSSTISGPFLINATLSDDTSGFLNKQQTKTKSLLYSSIKIAKLKSTSFFHASYLFIIQLPTLNRVVSHQNKNLR